MPQVLLIASDFPPNLSIASRRPFCLAKYLSVHGWESVVLTIANASRTRADHPGICLIESDLMSTPLLVRKFLDIIHGRQETAESNHNDPMLDILHHQSSSERIWITKLRQILYYPDRYFLFWFPKAVKKYLQLSKNFKIDAIISTAKPFTTHLIAKHIKSKINVPWIADFRDLWPHWQFFKNDNYYHRPKNLPNRLLVYKILKTADALVAVTNPSKLLLQKRFPAKSVYNIPNGFDPEEYACEIKTHPHKFLLTHTGHVRTDCQDPEILFKAISHLLQEKRIDKNSIKVRFYGEITDKFKADVTKYRISNIVEAKGIRKPRHEIILKQMESSLLLVFAALHEQNTGTAPGKIYEYLAARRPVLAIGKPTGADVLEDIITQTSAGIYARTLDQIKQTLILSYDEFMKSAVVKYTPCDNQIERFSYKNIAQEYTFLLDDLTREKRA